MPKWLSIFDTDGLFLKILFYQLKISVFWAIFVEYKIVLDSCEKINNYMDNSFSFPVY